MNTKIITFSQENKKTIIIIIMGILLFYWFAWRPSNIRKICATDATKKISTPANPYWDKEYGACLKKKGLKN